MAITPTAEQFIDFVNHAWQQAIANERVLHDARASLLPFIVLGFADACLPGYIKRLHTFLYSPGSPDKRVAQKEVIAVGNQVVYALRQDNRLALMDLPLCEVAIRKGADPTLVFGYEFDPKPWTAPSSFDLINERALPYFQVQRDSLLAQLQSQELDQSTPSAHAARWGRF